VKAEDVYENGNMMAVEVRPVLAFTAAVVPLFSVIAFVIGQVNEHIALLAPTDA
jgi:hypothetical protein